MVWPAARVLCSLVEVGRVEREDCYACLHPLLLFMYQCLGVPLIVFLSLVAFLSLDLEEGGRRFSGDLWKIEMPNDRKNKTEDDGFMLGSESFFCATDSDQ